MKTLIYAGAAALAIAAAPAVAQDMDDMDLTVSQQAMYDGWTVDQRTTYDAWPVEAQTYYWTLDDMQQDVWWNNLNDDQRVRIVGMDEQQQMATWTSIRSQMKAVNSNASPTATAATSAAATARSGSPRYVSGEVLQTTPASTNANGEYPICQGDVQDNCINPRAAGKNWGNRPLNYWPGKPASEIPGPKPVDKPS